MNHVLFIKNCVYEYYRCCEKIDPISNKIVSKNIVTNPKFCLYKSAGFHYNSTCVSGL